MNIDEITKLISETTNTKVLRSTITNAITELGLRMHPVHCEYIDGRFVYDNVAIDKIVKKVCNSINCSAFK
jgi:sporulation-control protein spo0M